MTVGSAFSVTLGLVAAFALGVWTGPRITSIPEREPSPMVTLVAAAAPAPIAPVAVVKPVVKPKAAPSVDISDPALKRQLKTVLGKGTDMAKAAEGFKSAEQFATIAYASRQTGVRFAVLKYRVLNEGKTLTSAIRESLPTTNAALEVERARAAARSTLQSIGG
jgi:hypothetical protein